MSSGQSTLIKDIMTTEVVTTTEAASLADVAQIFIEHKFNGLPVVDERGVLTGLLTEYNYITAAAKLLAHAEKMQPDEMRIIGRSTVGESMEREPLTLLFDDTFEKGLDLLFKHHRVNPIPVIDSEKKLVGIVSRHDFLKLIKVFGHS